MEAFGTCDEHRGSKDLIFEVSGSKSHPFMVFGTRVLKCWVLRTLSELSCPLGPPTLAAVGFEGPCRYRRCRASAREHTQGAQDGLIKECT